MQDGKRKALGALTVLGALACGLALSSEALLAQAEPGDGAEDETSIRRYEVTRLDLGRNGGRIEVLDRASGRWYVLVTGRKAEDAAVTVDPIAGEVVAREVRRIDEEPAEGEDPPVWPSDPRSGTGALRFEALDRQANRPVIFDGELGRIYVVVDDTEMRVYDPVEGSITTRSLQIADGAGVLERRSARVNELEAIEALRAIATAQDRFREEDSEGDGSFDYGNLTELGDAALIDAALASGTRQGYLFEVRSAPETPEFLWMATATPEDPGVTGRRHFVTNHAGTVYYSLEKPFSFREDCQIPKDARPIQR